MTDAPTTSAHITRNEDGTSSLSLTETIAWALASRNLARREGFPRVAAAIDEDLALLTAARDAGHHTLRSTFE